MDREHASSAAPAWRLPRSNGQDFSCAKVWKPFVFPLGVSNPNLDRIVTFPSHRGQSKVSTINRGDDGADLARKIDMFGLSAVNLIGGLVLDSLGFVSFIYGRRCGCWEAQ